MEEQLARAIEWAKAGHKAEARDLLIWILNKDPRSVTAWKWFASVARSEDEARQAIRNILSLAPDDIWAQRALSKLDTPKARPSARRRRRSRRGKDVPLWLVAGLAVAAAVLCVAGFAVAMFRPGTQPLNNPVVAAVQGTPAPIIVGGDSALNPPGLPPSWTPSSVPTLPTVTPMPTTTPTLTPGPTVTKVPTPAVLDAPPQSDFEFVPVAAPPTGSGPVIESQSIVYYPVTGSNALEINQSILNNGPKGGGQDAIAQVQYTISLQYTVQQSGNACTPSQAVAYLSMEFTYPQYTPPPNAPQSLINDWNAFLQRVVTHEETHAVIARDCANQMVSGFYTLPANTACSALESNLDSLLSAVDSDCEARQLAYDQAEGGDSFP